MELKSFIKSTITQIVESIEELNAELSSDTVIVNPTDVKKADTPVSYTHLTLPTN